MAVAVDAIVLIFERIREESAKGKSFPGRSPLVMTAPSARCSFACHDAHLIILIYTGTGPIKGFGVTLTIGVFTGELVTALVVTRLLFDLLLARGWLETACRCCT